MRAAYTLVELMVVLFVITVLIGLIFPAINSVRELARQTQCINNQKQLAYALQQYNIQRKVLPGWQDFVTVRRPDNPNVEVSALASWVFMILPYIEQVDLLSRLQAGQISEARPFDTNSEIPPIPTLLCRSNLTAQSGIFTNRSTNYVVNGGAVDFYDNSPIPDHNTANGPFLDRASLSLLGAEERWDQATMHLRAYRNTTISLSDISKWDGTAYTLLTAENVHRGFWISREIVHFYNDRTGGDRAADALLVGNRMPAMGNADWADGGGYVDVPGRGDGGLASMMNGTRAGQTIEGSVAFCWPRDPRTGGYPDWRDSANPYRGFFGLTETSTGLSSRSQGGIYWPPGGDDLIPVYVNYFQRERFPESWYTSARPSSNHPGVFIASFCDGNVRKIRESVDERAFVSMMTTHATRSDAAWHGRPYESSPFLFNYLFDTRELE